MSEQRAEYVLWSGQVGVRDKDSHLDALCRVTFNLERKNPTQFVVDSLSFRPNTNSVFIRFPYMPNEVEAYVVQAPIFGDGPGIFSPRFSRSWCGNGQLIRKVHGGIVNLGRYIFVGPCRNNLLELVSKDGWGIRLQSVPQSLEFPRFIQCDEYQFTHHFCIARTDSSTFSAQELEKQIDKLCTFLSFCRGAWVSTALSIRMGGSGELAIAEWGTGQISRASASDPSWLDDLHGADMAILYPAFCDKTADEAFAETFRIVLYWYIRSDTNNVGPDGGLILLQTALERIAWQVLVRDRHALNAEGFGRLTACDQLRLLLTMLSIPTAVPAELEELAKLGRTNSADGPQCLTLIRNRLVHPPNKSTSRFSFPYYNAYVLARWYLELILLRLLGYEGVYSNRTNRQWNGQVESVPWTKRETL